MCFRRKKKNIKLVGIWNSPAQVAEVQAARINFPTELPSHPSREETPSSHGETNTKGYAELMLL